MIRFKRRRLTKGVPVGHMLDACPGGALPSGVVTGALPRKKEGITLIMMYIEINLQLGN